MNAPTNKPVVSRTHRIHVDHVLATGEVIGHEVDHVVDPGRQAIKSSWGYLTPIPSRGQLIDIAYDAPGPYGRVVSLHRRTP